MGFRVLALHDPFLEVPAALGIRCSFVQMLCVCLEASWFTGYFEGRGFRASECQVLVFKVYRVQDKVESIPNGYNLRFVESPGKAEYGFLART